MFTQTYVDMFKRVKEFSYSYTSPTHHQTNEAKDHTPCAITYIEDVVVVVDLDAGARLVRALDDGGGAAAGALQSDGLFFRAVHLTQHTRGGGVYS